MDNIEKTRELANSPCMEVEFTQITLESSVVAELLSLTLAKVETEACDNTIARTKGHLRNVRRDLAGCEVSDGCAYIVARPCGQLNALAGAQAVMRCLFDKDIGDVRPTIRSVQILSNNPPTLQHFGGVPIEEVADYIKSLTPNDALFVNGCWVKRVGSGSVEECS